MWQAVKDKKRRVAQKLAERRRSSTGDGAAPTPYLTNVDPEFMEDRQAHKDYTKTCKKMQQKVSDAANKATAFVNAFRELAVCFDEFEGGDGSSRGDQWLLAVDQFKDTALAQIETSTGAVLDVLRTREQAAIETKTGIRRLTDRETDLRSYERRVHEAKSKAQPKPETIAKFTAKQENAKADVATMTAAVKADLQFMDSTRLTAHQPAADAYFKSLADVMQQASALLAPAPGGGSGTGIGSMRAKASSMMASMGAALPSVPPIPSLSGGGGGAGNSGSAPPNRSAPNPAGSPSGSSGPPTRISLSSRLSGAQNQAKTAAVTAGVASVMAGGGAAGNKAALNSMKNSAQAAVGGPPRKAAPSPPGRPMPAAPASGPPSKPPPAVPTFGDRMAQAKAGMNRALDKGYDAAKGAGLVSEGTTQRREAAAAAAAAIKPGARAKFAFTPEQPDELKLSAGEEIFNLVKVEDDWYRGETADGRKGIFPANYVEML